MGNVRHPLPVLVGAEKAAGAALVWDSCTPTHMYCSAKQFENETDSPFNGWLGTASHKVLAMCPRCKHTT